MTTPTKVFIVVERVAYEGDTVMRVFANYKDAVAYADELTAALELPLGKNQKIICL